MIEAPTGLTEICRFKPEKGQNRLMGNEQRETEELLS
jgi:hypothetical protein